jgi:hypothetical protein
MLNRASENALDLYDIFRRKSSDHRPPIQPDRIVCRDSNSVAVARSCRHRFGERCRVFNSGRQRGQDGGCSLVNCARVFPRTSDQRLGGPAVASAPPIVRTRLFWRSAPLKNPLQAVATFDDAPIRIELRDQSGVAVRCFQPAHGVSAKATHSANRRLSKPGPSS